MRMTETSNKVLFFKKYPEFNKYEKEYNNILLSYKEILWKELSNGKVYNTSIGSFEMIRYFITNFKKIPIDYKSTKEERYEIKHLNEHTDGYKCILLFTPKGSLKKYKFKTCRHFNRHLAKYLKASKENYKKYYEVCKHK